MYFFTTFHLNLISNTICFRQRNRAVYSTNRAKVLYYEICIIHTYILKDKSVSPYMRTRNGWFEQLEVCPCSPIQKFNRNTSADQTRFLSSWYVQLRHFQSFCLTLQGVEKTVKERSVFKRKGLIMNELIYTIPYSRYVLYIDFGLQGYYLYSLRFSNTL